MSERDNWKMVDADCRDTPEGLITYHTDAFDEGIKLRQPEIDAKDARIAQFELAYAELLKQEPRGYWYPCEDSEGSTIRRAKQDGYEALYAKQMPPAIPDMKLMIDRFLSWKLPKDFGPDCGISFNPTKPYEGDKFGNSWWPIGTNLLHAGQVKEMLEYVLAVSQVAQKGGTQ